MLTTWQHHHLRFSASREMKKLFWSRFTLAMAGGLVSIFVPIFLLRTGVSFPSLLLFYLEYSLLNIIAAPIAIRFIVRFGANKAMVSGGLIQIIVYSLFATYHTYFWPLPLIAFLSSVANELYWPAFHANFSKAEKVTKAGTTIGSLSLVLGASQALTPLVGGLAALAFGFSDLFWAAAVILFFGIIPLLFEREVIDEKNYALKELNFREIGGDLHAQVGYGWINLVEGITWPVIIYLVVGNLAVVGGLGTLTLIISVFTAIFVGHRLDRFGGRRYLKLGTYITFTLNLGRILADNTVLITGLNFFSGALGPVSGTAMIASEYRNASTPQRLSYLLAFELAWWVGWTVVLGYLYILSTFFPSPKALLTVSLIFAAVGGVLIRRIRS